MSERWWARSLKVSAPYARPAGDQMTAAVESWLDGLTDKRDRDRLVGLVRAVDALAARGWVGEDYMELFRELEQFVRERGWSGVLGAGPSELVFSFEYRWVYPGEVT